MKFRSIMILTMAAACSLSFVAGNSLAANPIATDSRIRTFVYGENEVFNVLTRYGYQSSIEFGDTEKILTISLGNPVAFKVTPAENRLFVKTLQNDSRTNMTIITDHRTYQFDLSSEASEGQDLVYVMRFYYPESDFNNKKFEDAAVSESVTADIKDIIPAAVSATNYNYNYSISGPDSVAPVKIFDDGKGTFFKFPGNNLNLPAFYLVGPDGYETPVAFKPSGEFVVVEKIAGRMSLRFGEQVVCVFNDNIVP